MILRKIPHNHFFTPLLTILNFALKKEYSLNHLENLSNFLNQNIKISRFNIRLIDSKYKTEAKRLLPDNNYVGFSLTQGNVYREKKWNIKNFINLAKRLQEKNKQPVFLLRKKILN